MAELDVDFVGLHLINCATELKLERAALLCRVALSIGISPVLLTKLKEVSTIMHALETTGARWLQLHTPWCLDALSNLRKAAGSLGDLQIISLISPETVGDRAYVQGVAALADFVILDHSMGGSGLRLPQEVLDRLFEQIPAGRVFLAGGLTASNVSPLVATYCPYAVDVQSGVIGDDGEQDVDKIRSFVAAVRSVPLCDSISGEVAL